MKKLFLLPALLFTIAAQSQTASSLFWRSDSLQVSHIESSDNKQYSKVGHHGPAVENRFTAFRIYYNNTGAIDVYSKSGAGMELLKYLWYPTEAQMKQEGAGCDDYFVGKSVGLGGIHLWDGEKEIQLVMSGKREANVGKTRNGCYAEVISYGVPYRGSKIDVSLRVDVYDNSRVAKVTATCLSGEKVQFVTGVNWNKGARISCSRGRISVWGTHPANVSLNPIPLGGGMRFSPSRFSAPEKTDNMVRIISKPARSISTRIVCGSAREVEINSAEKLEAFRF